MRLRSCETSPTPSAQSQARWPSLGCWAKAISSCRFRVRNAVNTSRRTLAPWRSNSATTTWLAWMPAFQIETIELQFRSYQSRSSLDPWEPAEISKAAPNSQDRARASRQPYKEIDPIHLLMDAWRHQGYRTPQTYKGAYQRRRRLFP